MRVVWKITSRTGPRADLGLLGRELGSEGLDGLRQGLEQVGVGGLADGVEHGTEGGMGLLGCELGSEGLDGLRQCLELVAVVGPWDGVDDGPTRRAISSWSGRRPKARMIEAGAETTVST